MVTQVAKGTGKHGPHPAAMCQPHFTIMEKVGEALSWTADNI